VERRSQEETIEFRGRPKLQIVLTGENKWNN
jgi:hypothetical protein